MKAPSRQQSAKILVVDDDRINRIALEKTLMNQGYEVVLAESGMEALDLLPKGVDSIESNNSRSEEFDAVILDIMMPEVDGIAVLHQIRQYRSPLELPVIMATAKDQSSDMVKLLNLGANDYVTKPIDIPVLFARLATHLDVKKTHKALREAQHSLIQAAKQETVRALAAGVAHEIRNPFAKILMAGEAISSLECVKNDESAKQLSSLMIEAIDDADSIVKRLMEFSRCSDLSLINGNINQLIEETVDLLTDEIPGKIGFELDLSPNPELVRIAPVEFQQALINLIMNSVQAMPDGGKIYITTGTRLLRDLPAMESSRNAVRLHNGREACFIEIEDTGPGISPENLELIFDAFFTTKPTGSGAGLGLTIARKTIDLHEGLIFIDNRKDKNGTKVTIYLLIAGQFPGDVV